MADQHNDLDDEMDLRIDGLEDVDEFEIDGVDSDAVEEVDEGLGAIEELEDLESSSGFSAEPGYEESGSGLSEPEWEEEPEAKEKAQKKSILKSPSTWVLVVGILVVFALMAWKLAPAGPAPGGEAQSDEWQPPENYPDPQVAEEPVSPSAAQEPVSSSQTAVQSSKQTDEGAGVVDVGVQNQSPRADKESFGLDQSNADEREAQSGSDPLTSESSEPRRLNRSGSASFDEMAVLAARINEIEQFMVSEEFVDALRRGVSREIEADLEADREQMRADIRADMRDELTKMVRTLVSDTGGDSGSPQSLVSNAPDPNDEGHNPAPSQSTNSRAPAYEIMGSTEGLVFLRDLNGNPDRSEFSLMEGDRLASFGQVASINAMGCVRFDSGRTLPTKDRVCR